MGDSADECSVPSVLIHQSSLNNLALEVVTSQVSQGKVYLT